MSQIVSKFFERRKIKEYILERSWNISVIHNGLKFITQNAAVQHKQPLHSAGIPEL